MLNQANLDNTKLYHILGLNSIKFYDYLFRFTAFYEILRGIFFLFVSDSLFWRTSENGRKGGAKRREKEPNAKAQPKAQDTNVVLVTDVTEGVTSVTQNSLVTDVTHGVTSVTPLPYFLGASNASETWRDVEECWALYPRHEISHVEDLLAASSYLMVPI